eukprot:COSAG06_NODE_13_length_35352_cov_49.626255_34_plen_595_part_00
MHCAVKRFRFSKDDAALTETFANEVFLLKNLSHDNLVRFFGACTTPPNLCILTELMTGSLLSLLYGSLARRPDGTLRELNDKRQAHILKGVATGMAFLHSHSVAHRDLKSANVLYDKQLNIKLCDFAFSKFKRQLSGLMDSQVGTPAWMAPEVLRGDEYTLKCDVFSAGVIMWELVHREEPLKGVNQYAVAIKVGMEGHRLPIDKSCPLIWRRLMESCWAEPDDRPSFAEIEGILTEAKRSIKHGATLRELSSNGAVGSSTANHKPGSDVVLLDPHASAAAARATSAVRKPVSTPTPEVVAALAALTKQPSTDAEAQDDSTSASAAAPSPAGSGSGGGEDDGSEGGGARRIPEGVPIRMMSRPGQGPSSSDRIGNSVSPRAAKAPSAEATWEGGTVPDSQGHRDREAGPELEPEPVPVPELLEPEPEPEPEQRGRRQSLIRQWSRRLSDEVSAAASIALEATISTPEKKVRIGRRNSYVRSHPRVAVPTTEHLPLPPTTVHHGGKSLLFLPCLVSERERPSKRGLLGLAEADWLCVCMRMRVYVETGMRVMSSKLSNGRQRRLLPSSWPCLLWLMTLRTSVVAQLGPSMTAKVR